MARKAKRQDNKRLIFQKYPAIHGRPDGNPQEQSDDIGDLIFRGLGKPAYNTALLHQISQHDRPQKGQPSGRNQAPDYCDN